MADNLEKLQVECDNFYSNLRSLPDEVISSQTKYYAIRHEELVVRCLIEIARQLAVISNTFAKV